MNQPPYSPYEQPQQAMSAVDMVMPTNPLAAVACWVGILSLFTCYGGIVLGPVALVTGVISLKKGAVIRESAYGRGTSLARSWIGIVTGVIGTLVGFAAIALALLHHH